MKGTLFCRSIMCFFELWAIIPAALLLEELITTFDAVFILFSTRITTLAVMKFLVMLPLFKLRLSLYTRSSRSCSSFVHLHYLTMLRRFDLNPES